MSQIPEQTQSQPQPQQPHIDPTSAPGLLPINPNMSMINQAQLPPIMPNQQNLIPNMYIQGNIPPQEDTSNSFFI